MDINGIFEKIKTHYLFKYLNKEEGLALLRLSCIKQVPSRQMIWEKHEKIDYIIIIIEGRLKISLIDKDGNEFAIKYIYPIDSLGDATILYNQGQMADVWTIENSKLIYIFKKDIINAANKNPRVLEALCEELSMRVNNLTDELELQVFNDAKFKIIYKLLQLKTKDTLEIDITHQQLAELIGMTRERLTLSLKDLEKEGLIKKSRGKIVITNYKSMVNQGF